MTLSPSEHARHHAAVLRSEADVRSQSDQAHQRAFAVTLRQWADNADSRAERLAADEAPAQQDLFGEAA